MGKLSAKTCPMVCMLVRLVESAVYCLFEQSFDICNT